MSEVILTGRKTQIIKINMNSVMLNHKTNKQWGRVMAVVSLHICSILSRVPTDSGKPEN